jgi:lysophospholipase L1-like esterase
MKRKVLYPVFLVVFVLIATEISVRLLHLAPSVTMNNPDWNFVADPYLPYKQRPFSVISGRSRTDEYDAEYRHNSKGFRDTEHSFAKPEGVFRIVGVGDSFTYGQGAQFEETYLYRLEKMLNQRGGNHPEVEIIKAGIPRYFPEAERLYLEHYGMKYKPDLILVGFLANDVIDTFLGIDAVTVSEDGGYLLPKEFGKIGVWLYFNSHLSRIILHKYRSYKNRRYRFSEVYKPDGFHEKDWQTVESEFGKMVELAGRAGARVAIIHIPQGIDDDSYSYPARRLSRLSQEQGFIFIDVLPAMKQAAGKETLYWEKDGHCNASGYRVIAETVYSYLTENGIVP